MSKRVVEQILMRVQGDGAFRNQLREHAESVLANYDLTEGEREALTQGNGDALLEFGVDKRLVQMLPPGIYTG